MGTAVHTGVGWGAIRPSGRSVQPNGLTDFAFVHGGQYGTSDNLVFSDVGSVQGFGHPNYIDSVFFSEVETGALPNSSHADTFIVADQAAQTNATYPTFLETPFTPTDNASGHLVAGNNTDTVVEQMFGTVRIDGSQETLAVSDNPIPNNSYNYRLTANDTLPVSDKQTARLDNSGETLPIQDSPTHP